MGQVKWHPLNLPQESRFKKALLTLSLIRGRDLVLRKREARYAATERNRRLLCEAGPEVHEVYGLCHFPTPGSIEFGIAWDPPSPDSLLNRSLRLVFRCGRPRLDFFKTMVFWRPPSTFQEPPPIRWDTIYVQADRERRCRLNRAWDLAVQDLVLSLC